MVPGALILLLACAHVRPVPVAAPTTTPAAARLHFLAGRLAIEEEDWELADRELQQALLFDPGSPWIWMALADAAQGAGEDLEERRRAQEAVRLGPELAASWTRLAQVNERAGDLRAAMEGYRAAIDRGAGVEAWFPLCKILQKRDDPLYAATVREWSRQALSDPDALRERGRMRLHIGDLGGAVDDLGEVIVGDPRNARLLDEYLTAVTGSGRYRQGLERLVTLHRLAPRDTDVLLRTFHLAAKAHDKVRSLDALVALDALLGGREAQVKLWLADAWSAVGQHDEAREAVEAGAACDPPLADAGYHRARILRAAGRSADALKVLVIPVTGPNRPDALALQVRLLVDLGKPAEARTLVQGALQALPDDYVLLGALVTVEAARGDREAMLAAVDRMAMLDPEARARTRARSLAGLGDVDAAIEALEATPLGQPESWIVGGTLLREAGRLEDARRWLSRGVDRYPKSAAIRAELGLAEAAADQADSALVAMREALALDPGEARAARYYAGAVEREGTTERLKQARTYLLAALERQPGDATLLAALGRMEYALHQPLRAVEAWEEAARYVAPDAELRAQMARAYREVGRDALAAQIEASGR